MKARCWLVAAALVLLPAATRAQGLTGRFTIAAQIGTQSEVAGDMLNGTSGSLLGKPVTIDSQRYRDIYAPDLRLQGVLGFGISDRTEVIGKFTWYKTEAVGGLEAGTFDDKPLFVYFPEADHPDSYEEVGLELGVRYYLAIQSRLKSYIAPILGVRWVTNDTAISFSVPEAGSSIQNIPFTDKGTVPVFGLDIGFTFDLGERAYVGMDTGIRYQTATNGFDYLNDLAKLDNSGGRWTAPVLVVLGVRF
jgi:hypothetical protein